MPNRVVIIGRGGQARETLMWFRDWAAEQRSVESHWEFAGFLSDPAPDAALIDALGAPYLGSADELAGMDVRYYVAVGDPAMRRTIDEQARAAGARPGPPIVHPTAIIGDQVRIGDGSVICPGTVITTNITIGQHVLLNYNATVGHDTVIEDYVTVGPLASISGNVTLGEGVMVGTNAAINEKLTVGAWSKIGSGAAVVRDIPEGVTAVGVPAKPLER